MDVLADVVGAFTIARDRFSNNMSCTYADRPRKLSRSGVNSTSSTRVVARSSDRDLSRGGSTRRAVRENQLATLSSLGVRLPRARACR